MVAELRKLTIATEHESIVKKKTLKEEKIPFYLMTRDQKREHARALWRKLKWHMRASKMVFLAQQQVEDNFMNQFKQDMNFEQDVILNQINNASNADKSPDAHRLFCCRVNKDDAY